MPTRRIGSTTTAPTAGQLTIDAGAVKYTSSVTTRDVEVGGPGMNAEVGDVELLIGQPLITSAPSSLTVTTVGSSRIAMRLTIPRRRKRAPRRFATSALHVSTRAAETGLSGIRYAHWIVADATNDVPWALDTIVVPVTHHEALSR